MTGLRSSSRHELSHERCEDGIGLREIHPAGLRMEPWVDKMVRLVDFRAEDVTRLRDYANAAWTAHVIMTPNRTRAQQVAKEWRALPFRLA